MAGASKAEVLRRTKDTLVLAQLGLRDLLGANPTRRPGGIYNVAVFGRSVTFALQNLRTLDREGFDEWYAPYQKEMREDPLLRYFTELRNVILKQGPPQTTSSMSISGVFSIRDFMPGPPPPGALGFFMGDQLGGSGWEVELPDGSTQKYYVELPEVPGVDLEMGLRLSEREAPTEHLGQPITDPSAENLCRLYVGYLERLVEDSEAQFGT